ncbi:MAG: hypothetical protein J3R72DRAFT_501892 [Linnemannia gamsii]|nr:MAG: hypothetical protein J3R72DRAFT_501892 [Linnemannia gamsii]
MFAIWFKIDFDVHARFAEHSPDIVAKHGHHIRIVPSPMKGVHSLAIQHEQMYEIVARNNPSLDHLYLFARSSTSKHIKYPIHSVMVSALILSSSLDIAGDVAVVYFDLEREELGIVTDLFKKSSQHLKLISRCCPALKEYDLPGHELDMDEVEVEAWVCKDLKMLLVRIKDLDIKEKTPKVIALWRKGCWHRWREKAGMPAEAVVEQDATDMSIEARVTRHLLKFDRLWRVWFGYQTWTPSKGKFSFLSEYSALTTNDPSSCHVQSPSSPETLLTYQSSVDFDDHPQFADLLPAIAAKHEHLTRIVSNAESPLQTVSRNSFSLKDLYLFAANPVVDKYEHSSYHISAPGMLPSAGLTPPITSKLEDLTLESLCITYGSLVAILQGCPESQESLPSSIDWTLLVVVFSASDDLGHLQFRYAPSHSIVSNQGGSDALLPRHN